VEAWATAPFIVTCPRQVASIQLDRDWGEIAEQISGEVTLAGRPVADEVLQVRLVDRQGRILMRQEVVPQDEPVRFRFVIEPWLPMLVRVEAALLEGAAEVTSDHRFAHVVKRHRDQFNFLTWEAPDFGPLGDYVEEALARLGITQQLVMRKNSLREIAAHDIALVPYTTRVTASYDENGVMKPACWNDEPGINEHVEKIIEHWGPARQHGVFVYSLGDETVTRGSCVHPACLAAYRRYLQTQYPTIDALNASWGTDFARFEDVQLSTPKDNDEEVAKQQKNYPRWFDRRAFQSYNFVQLCERFGQAFRAIDPEARVGFEGAGRFDMGDDFDLIVRSNGFWAPYAGPGDEVIRSIARPGFIRSSWMGYSKEANVLQRHYWRMITHGCDSVWWWMWQNIGQWNGLVMPTLSPFPAIRELTKDTQIVRDGLGTLLIHSQMLDDGIALLYSMPSAYAVSLEAGPLYGSYSASHQTWSRLIRELGLQYRYVTARMLRRGEFKSEKYKTLVLARSEALGPAEADVIRRFAQDGGTVIADLRPGIYDHHCKPMSSGGGMLDDLFGVRTTVDPSPTVGEAVISGTLAGQPVRIEWDKTACEPGVTLIDAEALGQRGPAPLVIVRKVGRGQVVLLNFAVNLFPDIQGPDAPEAAAQFFQQLFAYAGVGREIKVQGEDGRRIGHVEVVRWREGDTQLLALFRERGELQNATVSLPEARHVYDLRQRQYLGRVGSFPTQIRPDQATFFALTPEKVGPVEIRLAQRALSRGQVAQVSMNVPGAGGTRAVRISVWKPDQQEVESLRRVVMVDPAGATCSLPIAYNDPAGTWTVQAVELFTNRITTAPLQVQ
jgi:beta-galactosidase